MTETTVPAGYTGSAPQVFDISAPDNLRHFTVFNSQALAPVLSKCFEDN